MKKEIKKEDILPSITTTNSSDWRAKIKEAEQLGIAKAAIFPTCLAQKERKELYALLENSKIKNIPFVHIRQDMELWELDYLVKKYDTRAFNVHMQIEFPLLHDYSKYKDRIFIENVFNPFDENELKNFGGICLDMAHLETDRRLYKDIFDHDLKIMEKFPVGANHISAIKNVTKVDVYGGVGYDWHRLENFSELDYLKNYSLNFFSNFIAIELENEMKEQLKIKDYIWQLISQKK